VKPDGESLLKKRWQSGQSFVEMAIGMTVLVILLGGVFDIARAMLILIAVENATGEGALYGATHLECVAPDHSPTICQGSESVAGRVRAEGEPMITIDPGNVTIALEDSGTVVALTSGSDIVAGRTLRIDVTYSYTPTTPVGFWLWGNKAEVKATARQEILSPPPPGYKY
jgi:Flp pilus assembly protein TadG